MRHFDDCHEFVAAESRQELALAQDGGKASRHLLQKKVARRVAEAIVDAFELI